MIRISHDPEADAVYVRFAKQKSSSQKKSAMASFSISTPAAEWSASKCWTSDSGFPMPTCRESMSNGVKRRRQRGGVQGHHPALLHKRAWSVLSTSRPTIAPAPPPCAFPAAKPERTPGDEGGGDAAPRPKRCPPGALFVEQVVAVAYRPNPTRGWGPQKNAPLPGSVSIVISAEPSIATKISKFRPALGTW